MIGERINSYNQTGRYPIGSIRECTGAVLGDDRFPQTVEALANCEQTRHYLNTRGGRHDILIEESKRKRAKIVDVFKVQENWQKKPNLGLLQNKATIIVLNDPTLRLVTVEFARPQQLRNLYNHSCKVAPEHVMNAAENNEQSGRNKI